MDTDKLVKRLRSCSWGWSHMPKLNSHYGRGFDDGCDACAKRLNAILDEFGADPLEDDADD